jgi:hypothetical protein
MRLFPSRKQWNTWSLPSRLTAIGAYVGLLSVPLAVLGLVLSRPSHTPINRAAILPPPVRLDLRLELFIGGFQVRVRNLGSVPARGITLSLETWQIHAPGPEVRKEIAVRDLAPHDELVHVIELLSTNRR